MYWLTRITKTRSTKYMLWGWNTVQWYQATFLCNFRWLVYHKDLSGFTHITSLEHYYLSKLHSSNYFDCSKAIIKTSSSSRRTRNDKTVQMKISYASSFENQDDFIHTKSENTDIEWRFDFVVGIQMLKISTNRPLTQLCYLHTYQRIPKLLLQSDKHLVRCARMVSIMQNLGIHGMKPIALEDH